MGQTLIFSLRQMAQTSQTAAVPLIYFHLAGNEPRPAGHRGQKYVSKFHCVARGKMKHVLLSKETS